MDRVLASSTRFRPRTEKAAATDPTSAEPVANPAPQNRVTETALRAQHGLLRRERRHRRDRHGAPMLLSGIGFLGLTPRVHRDPAGEATAAKTAAPRRQAVTA